MGWLVYGEGSSYDALIMNTCIGLRGEWGLGDGIWSSLFPHIIVKYIDKQGGVRVLK